MAEQKVRVTRKDWPKLLQVAFYAVTISAVVVGWMVFVYTVPALVIRMLAGG